MLIDTSGFLCLLHKDESEHAIAVAEFEKTRSSVTHNYILGEFIPRARSRGFPSEKSLEFSRIILRDPGVEVAWVDSDLHRDALALRGTRKDKGYSLCDAVSFVIMRKWNLADALTTDRHFEQEGFNRKLR